MLLAYFNTTPLCYAVRKNNIEIVRLLLENPDIDVNTESISNKILITFKIIEFNCIANFILIIFYISHFNEILDYIF